MDIFDTVLYGMVRVPSIETLLGKQHPQIEYYSRIVDNWQLFGLLLGGIIWGILGDKKGRLKVLYGSIIVYSIATFFSGMVQSVFAYGALRFIAGLGLAGELGAGITLVNEILTKEKRGLATAFIAVIGILGAVFAGILVKLVDNWRWVYYIGGLLGIMLLVLRLSVKESMMFLQAKAESKKLGDFLLIFKRKALFRKYISLILLAFPIAYVVHLYAKYTPELALSLGLTKTLNSDVATNTMMLIYLGLSFGDISSGLLSNYLQSRKKVIVLFIGLTILSLLLFWTIGFHSLFGFYAMIILLGFSAGYWAVYVSLTTESYGTNLRATVTTSVPNFVRGLAICINLLYMLFSQYFNLGVQSSVILIGVISISLAILSIKYVPETFRKDLNYIDN